MGFEPRATERLVQLWRPPYLRYFKQILIQRGKFPPPKSFSCFDQSTPTYNLKRLNFYSEPKFWVAGRENCC